MTTSRPTVDPPNSSEGVISSAELALHKAHADALISRDKEAIEKTGKALSEYNKINYPPYRPSPVGPAQAVDQAMREAMMIVGAYDPTLNPNACESAMRNTLERLAYAVTPREQGAQVAHGVDFGCELCGAPYGKDGWCDVVVPDEVWNSLGYSLLCFRCMTKELVARGLNDVPVIVASGPYKDANETWRLIGLEHGRKNALAAAQSAPADEGTRAGGGIEDSARAKGEHLSTLWKAFMQWKSSADKATEDDAAFAHSLGVFFGYYPAQDGTLGGVTQGELDSHKARGDQNG